MYIIYLVLDSKEIQFNTLHRENSLTYDYTLCTSKKLI